MNRSQKMRAWLHAYGARALGLSLFLVSSALFALQLSQPTSSSLTASVGDTSNLINERVAVIPLGILIVTFARTVVGVQTIGTFMPVLLALTIAKVGVSHSLILITLVLVSGVLLSFGLRSFKLLPMPRTASMIVIVIFMIQGYQHLSAQLGFKTEHLFNAFPLMVLAWMVERLADTIDNQSVRDGVVRVLGSLSVSLVCCGVFSVNLLSHFLNTYLEVHFAVLGLMLCLGTYTGLTLTEWVSYAALANRESLAIPSLESDMSHDDTDANLTASDHQNP